MALILILAGHARAQAVPQLINYQGRLVDAAGAPMVETAEYNVSISIYSTTSGATAVWGPQRFDGGTGQGRGARVPIVSGFFNVILGPVDTTGRSIGDAFGAPERYIGVTIWRQGEAEGIELTPRQAVLTSPFSFSSQRAARAGSVDPGSIHLGDLDTSLQEANETIWFRAATEVTAIPNVTDQPVKLRLESSSHADSFNASNSTFTAPLSGIYIAFTQLIFQAFGGQGVISLQTKVLVNGEEKLAGLDLTTTLGYNWEARASGILTLSAGDVVTVRVRHNFGSTLNVMSQPDSFVLVRVAPLPPLP